MNKIVLAIGGSSGSIYAKRLMDKIKTSSQVDLSVVMTDNAIINWELELGKWDQSNYPFSFYAKDDFMAPFASGSAPYQSMVICPCSMGLVGRIASGISNDLITRAADVMLKEQKKLIVVPRETPFNLIHLRNLTSLAEAGTLVLPASPSFYAQPKDIEAVVDTVVDRILDHLNVDVDTYRWGSA